MDLSRTYFRLPTLNRPSLVGPLDSLHRARLLPAVSSTQRPKRFTSEAATIFTVVSKADGSVVARAQGEPFFGIHQINCFERDGAILFDVPAYPEGRHISNLYLDRRAAAEALETSQIKRYTIPLNGRDVTSEVLFDEFAELPTIDYKREAGLDRRSTSV